MAGTMDRGDTGRGDLDRGDGIPRRERSGTLRQALSVFEAALDVPPRRRRAFVEARTMDAPEVRTMALRLLAADADPPRILRGSLSGTTTRMGRDRGRDPGGPDAGQGAPGEGGSGRVGRYELRRLLGEGGMGRVHLAWDTLLRREVAIKVFSGGAGLEGGRKARLLGEARAASSIDHPHVCPVHDLGEDESGRPYIVMAYCEGETLRDRLRRGPLGADEAVAIARQMARGLGAAHARGVVHRDVKPGNIMLTTAGVKLLDFGIADLGGERVTREGALVGTLSYMSPERAAGARGDERSDVWSLGVVLFEMVTGTRPFDGAHDAETLHRILESDPPSPTALVPELPDGLAAAILTMLRRDPGARYGSMAEVVAALEGPGGTTTPDRGARLARRPVAAALGSVVVVGVLAAGLVLATGGIWEAARGGAGDAAARATGRGGPGLGTNAGGSALAADRVVVLPFENQTGVDSLKVVAEWAAEWIGLELMQAGVASVVPASAARAAVLVVEEREGARTGVDLARAVALELGARIAITGVIFREGDRLEFHTRLLDAERGQVVRALEPVDGTVEQPSAGFPALRTRAVSATALLTGSEFAAFTALQSQPPTYQAYQEFSKGSALFAASEFVAAVPYFERAAALDPGYTLPLIYMVFSYGNAGEVRYENGVIQPLDSILRLVEARRPQLPLYDLHFLDFARALTTPNPDWEGALRAARELHRIAPGARTDYDVGANLVRLNRPAEAVEFLLGLDPTRGEMRGWMGYWSMLTRAHHLLGDHEAEEETALRARALNPRAGLAVATHTRALAALGRDAAVVALVDSALAGPALEGTVTQELLAEEALMELWAHGHRSAARQVHQRLTRRLEQRLRERGADPDLLGDLLLAHVLVEAWDPALATAEALRAIDPEDALLLGLEGVVLARTGRHDEARARVDRLARADGIYDMGRRISHTRGDLHPRRWAVEVAAAMGDSARAVALLRDARREGLRHGTWLHAAPGLRYLRGYAPFEALLEPAG
jgi:tetratricopeptide (TPR) repeat protein/TolB-like protein